MTDGATPALRFEINGKIVNFASVLGKAKPWKRWTVGEKAALDDVGFRLIDRGPTRELTYSDLRALVIYFAMQANRKIAPSDIDNLTDGEFGPMATAFAEAFGPRIFPPEPENPAQDVQSPFGGGDAPPSTPSDDIAAGDRPTSTG